MLANCKAAVVLLRSETFVSSLQLKSKDSIADRSEKSVSASYHKRPRALNQINDAVLD
jgi:hypothetical protein